MLLLAETVSPLLKSFPGARTVEFNRVLTLDEVLYGRIAVDIKLVAEFLLNSAIDLSNNKGRVLVGGTKLLPGRSKTLAVTTPWGKELHSKRLLGKLSLESGGSKRKNSGLHLFLGLLLFLRLLLFLGFLGLLKILVHKVHVSLNSARNTAILSITTIGDELDGGVTTDTKTTSKTLFNSAINFTNMELAIGLLSKFDPSGSKTLAVTTPWGKELDKPETFLGLLIEVGLSKDLNL